MGVGSLGLSVVAAILGSWRSTSTRDPASGTWQWKCEECGSVQPVVFGEDTARRWADAHKRVFHKPKAT